MNEMKIFVVGEYIVAMKPAHPAGWFYSAIPTQGADLPIVPRNHTWGEFKVAQAVIKRELKEMQGMPV